MNVLTATSSNAHGRKPERRSASAVDHASTPAPRQLTPVKLETMRGFMVAESAVRIPRCGGRSCASILAWMLHRRSRGRSGKTRASRLRAPAARDQGAEGEPERGADRGGAADHLQYRDLGPSEQ